MSIETIVWTVLPRKVDANVLGLSLYVSPRLQPPGITVLGRPGATQFPALADWSTRAKAAKFRIEFAGGPTLNAQAPADAVAIDPALWSKVFAETTPVVPFVFVDQLPRTVHSFSVRDVKAQVNGLYQTVANDTTLASSHPPLGRQAGANGSVVSQFIATVGVLGDLIQQTREKTGFDTTGKLFDQSMTEQLANRPQAMAFYKAWRFYNRPQGTLEEFKAPPAPTRPDLDFHQALTLLSDHPYLMRKLGIVIDLEVVVPTGMPVPKLGRARVATVDLGPGDPPAPDHKTPWTNYRLTDKSFLPAPRPGSDLAEGMLILADKERFEVSEVDTEGAALKVLDYAINLRRFQIQAQGINKPESAAMPALRAGGFGIARHQRTTALATQWDAAKKNNDNLVDPNLIQFSADDVTRGYRVDVLFRNKWYSLHQRIGKLTVGASDPFLAEVKDEGYVKGASGTSSTNPGVPDDMYLHESFLKWTGWSLSAPLPGRTIPETVPNAPDVPVIPVTETDPRFPVRAEYKAAMRTLPALRFGEPYRFRARAVDLAGNSQPPNVDLLGDWYLTESRPYLRYEPVAQPVLVPRAFFREGEAIEHMTIRTQVEHLHPHLPDAIFNPSNERHVLAPKTSQRMVEQHGMLDELFVTNPGLAYKISCKEQGAIDDAFVIDPFDPVATPYGKIPVSDVQKSTGQSQYFIRTGNSVPIPWLPDPLAQGVALKFPSGSIRTHFFKGDWPNMESFQFVLRDGPTIDFVPISEGIALTVPKAGIVKLRYSSLVEADGLDTMAYGRLLSGKNMPSTPWALAMLGQHWMVTPFRDLVLVHAVEQPLEDPQIVSVVPTRAPGDTFVDLAGRLHTESHSTGEVDFNADWTEDVDRVTDPTGPKFNEPHQGFVFNRKIGYEETNASYPNPPEQCRQEFGDTKYRKVKYWLMGTTRFREYFSPEVTGNKANITRRGPFTADVKVLSTARPEPPKVQYIVPTFRWQNTGGASRRVGRGLRVYVDRPWFTSGDDELLGVVIPGPVGLSTPPPPANMVPFTSQWGADPIWSSAPLDAELTASRFVNRVDAWNDVVIPNAPGKATVVGFKPEFDYDRKMWRVDIEMDTGGMFFPFVRLALGRFQAESLRPPWSSQDLRCSTVSKAEFAQLVADRTASVVRGRAGWDVMVSGPTAFNEAGVEINFPPPRDVITSSDLAPHDAVVNAISPSVGPIFSPVGDQLPGTGVLTLPPFFSYKLSDFSGAGHLVTAQIEWRSSEFLPDDDTLSWRPASAETTLRSYTTKGSTDVFWRGTVPDVQTEFGKTYRMIVKEYELYRTDSDTAEALPVSNAYGPMRSRLVYFDTIALSTMGT